MSSGPPVFLTLTCMILLACTDTKNVRPGIIVYEDISDRKDSDTSLVIDAEDGFLFEYDKYNIDYNIRQETDMLDLFKPKFDGKYFFDESNGILIPYKDFGGRWSAFGYSCTSDRQTIDLDGSGAAITCISANHPEWSYRFTYNPTRGVTSLVRPCPLYRPKLGCKFELKTREGIFSSGMRSRMVADHKAAN